MKKNYLHQQCWCLVFALFLFFKVDAQSTGEIAFVGFNSDGDDDFSIVTLVDVSANTTLYIKDAAGFITWNTGGSIINAGSIITFTDVDYPTNPYLGVTKGTITKSGTFNWSASGEAVYIYVGTDKDTPTTYIAGMINSSTAADLTGTGLTSGTNFLQLNTIASPDGGVYSASRANKATYAAYLGELVNPTNWSSNSTNGELFLPFSGELFSLTGTTINSWTGAISSIWNLAGNWSNGIPTASSIVTIPNIATSPVISSGTTAFAGNLTIEAGELLTINSANSLTVSGLLTITGDLSVQSGGSIIVEGSTTGNFTYSVHVADTNWHLISSPVVGEQYDDAWNIANSINVSGTGLNDAVSTYDNTVATGNWKYFQTGSTATSFNSAQGYSLKRTSAGNYGFIGAFSNDNVSPAISQNSNQWNLIGNPYPSYLDISSFISLNTANLPSAFQSIYVWNASTNSYNALTTGKIHTGQAFFINSNIASGTAYIAKSNQSHQTGITFYKTSSPQIKLSITDGDSSKFTEINYLSNKTTGLNPGLDIGLFDGVPSTLSIYSHLITQSEGIAFTRQALPDNDYENLIIPIGVNAESGKEVTFLINHQNLPQGLMVFLENTKEKTITRLDEANSVYKITLTEATSGIGRFYLRTSITDLRKTLNVTNNSLEQISMYVTTHRNLRITGLKNEKVNLTIHSLLGVQIFDQNLQSNYTVDISLPSQLKQGIYIVKIKTNNGSINKKIYIN